MDIIHINDHTLPQSPCVATIGFFDGVHSGHRYLLHRLTEDARQLQLQSTVITFDEHPRKVLHADYQPQMLSTLDEKLHLLAKTGVDHCALLHFTPTMAALSARDFMQQVLCRQLHVKRLYMGYDNRFGHSAGETFDDYVRYGRELGIEVVHYTPFELNGVCVSSSVIRSFLQAGEIAMANRCLGYPYTLVGKVVHGYRQGRLMGFPTANLDTTGWHKLWPAPGVYAVRARLDGSDTMYPAMMNIGTRPTFNGHELTLEVNLIDYSADIYDQMMLVSFVGRIRAEHKFNSPAELAQQLVTDREQAIQILKQIQPHE